MGAYFRKSKSFGGIRLNFSKSGIGVSAGIKGLRVGVNAKGQTYVSGGSNGLYYRKNISTPSQQANNTNPTQVNAFQTSNTVPINHPIKKPNAILNVVGIIFLFILVGALFANESTSAAALIPSIIIVVLIIRMANASSLQGNIGYVYNSITEAINSGEVDKLTTALKNVPRKLHKIEDQHLVYKNVYRAVLSSITNDNNISDEELEIVYLIRNNIPKEYFEQINNEFYENYVAEVVSDGVVTEDEKNALNSFGKKLEISDSKILETQSLFETVNKIESMKMNGIPIITTTDPIMNGKKCYYNGNVTIMKQRKQKGIEFFEYDNEAKLYISEDQVDIVSDGHRVIPLSEILDHDSDCDGTITLTILKKQKPFAFSTDDRLYVSAILAELLKKRRAGTP